MRRQNRESLHRDKDMTSSDIWILRHRLDSWFAAEQEQNRSDELKPKQQHISPHLIYDNLLGCSAAMRVQSDALWMRHN